MPTEFLREIAGPSGPLEARLDLPDGPPRAVAVCGHPHPLHGGTMHTKALYQTAKAFTRVGAAALRFNFRGVGLSAGSFDAGPGERDDFRAALDFAEARFPGLPLWAAGMSFGSWIAASVGGTDPRVSLVLLVAPAVDRWDFAELLTSEKPKFIIHGEDDELISAKDVRKFYAALPEPKELTWIEHANHLFEGKTSLVGDAVEELLADWQG
ncbi:MAG TPA: alpha/beta family hydrolase [Vicinamibacterales bacterium]|nr:alpha/beta family hydrolase [Vicinamibacterales bacterium]